MQRTEVSVRSVVVESTNAGATGSQTKRAVLIACLGLAETDAELIVRTLGVAQSARAMQRRILAEATKLVEAGS